MQETWLEQKNESNLVKNLDKNYNWHTKPAVKENRRGRAKGGVMVGVKKQNNIRVKVQEWEYGLKVTGLKVEGERTSCIIVTYNNVGMTKVGNKLEEEIEKYSDKQEKIVIVGDFNARIGLNQTTNDIAYKRNSEDKTKNREGEKLLKLCEENGCIIKNGCTDGDRKGELYVEGNGSVLDLIIEKRDEREDVIDKVKIITRTESDHLPVTFRIKNKHFKKEYQASTKNIKGNDGKLVWKEENRPKYEKAMSEKKKKLCEAGKNTTKWNDLKQTIYEAGTEAGMTHTPSPPTQKTIARELKEEVIKQHKKKVWKSLKKYLETKNRHDKESWKKEKSKLSALLEENKRSEYEEKWKEIEKSKDSAQFWKIINKYRPKKARKGENIKKEDWLNHFNKERIKTPINAGKDNADINEDTRTLETTNAETQTITNEHARPNSDPPGIEDLNKEIEFAEVETMIKKLKKGKAAGEDGIKGEFFKNMPKEWRQELTRIINNIWTNRKIEKGWKTARIYPIHKTGNEDIAENYRGVSLLDIGYKILAGIMD